MERCHLPVHPLPIYTVIHIYTYSVGGSSLPHRRRSSMRRVVPSFGQHYARQCHVTATTYVIPRMTLPVARFSCAYHVRLRPYRVPSPVFTTAQFIAYSHRGPKATQRCASHRPMQCPYGTRSRRPTVDSRYIRMCICQCSCR